MSSKRKIGKILAGVLFTLFLSIFIAVFSFVQITDYSKLRTSVTDLLSKQLAPSKDQLKLFIEQTCRNSKTVDIPVMNDKISIDCQSSDVIGEIADKTFDNLYFRNYSCAILDCLKNQQTMFAVFSLKANNFFNGYMLIFAMLTVLSAVFLVYFLSGWGIPKGIGISLVSVGIGYFIIGFTKNAIPQEILSLAGPLINLIVDTIAHNFLLVLIPGVILTVIGIAGSRLSKKK